MASSSATRGIYRSKQVSMPANSLPLLARRCGAWAAEVSLIVASALIPFSVGLYAQSHLPAKPVPLNPVLATAEEAVAKTLIIPMRLPYRQVSPLTNLLWTGALVTPLFVAGGQIYLLAKTGKTLPKRWFGLQVVTAAGDPPGFKRALLREGVGKWGIPLGVAYTIWRCSGAVPDLGILTGLAGLMLLADAVSAKFNPQRQTLHDRLAGTFILDAEGSVPKFQRFDAPRFGQSGASSAFNDEDEDATIAALVLTPETRWRRAGILNWIRQNPGVTLLIVTATTLGSVLITFVGTQVYIQSQVNWRQGRQQDKETFLQLVNKFAPDERRGAILAMGTLNQPDAQIQLLTDLLSLETEPQLMDAIGQALVTTGPKALPFLQRLNQSVRNDLESLRYGGNRQERQQVALRLRTTQRAIARILTLYNEQIHAADLSRTNLAETTSGSTQFTLVLDKTDLSRIQFKGAILTNASFQESRFYGAGEDRLFGTFDDKISDLSGADLKEANFTGALLSQVLMNGTSLIRANLNKANLSRAHLKNANLSSAQLTGANLGQAVLTNASLTGASLGEANLAGANLQGARLSQVKAVGTNFQWANLTQTEWQQADLSGADLRQSNLQNADLSSTRLVGANLAGAQLQSANFRNADLSEADLREAKLAGADFQGATFVAIVPATPDQFVQAMPAGSPSIYLQGVDFSLVKNLNVKQLTYICAQGGLHPKCALSNR